jgi:hemolysin activation/secretion protein
MARRFTLPGKRLLALAAGFMATALPGGVTYAQDVLRVAPKTPENTVPKPGEEAGAQTAEADDIPQLVGEDIPLLDSLKGVVLVPGEKDVLVTGLSGVSGLDIRNVDVPKPEGLRKRLEEFFGKPFSTVGLQNLTREIVLHYREEGRPVVDVVVPQQDITPGVVQLVIIEGRLGEVRTRNNRWFSDKSLIAKIRTEPGELLRQAPLLADLDWINSNPFRRVDLVYTPGGEVGRTDIVLDVKERFPVRVFGGIENTGTESTGEELLLAGFNWGNAFWLDHIFSYQFSSTTDLESLRGHSFVYDAPLPWRHTLHLLGLYVETEVNSELEALALNTGGESIQGSAGYEVPLPRLGKFKHAAILGFDFKQTNNNLEFGGIRVFDVTTDILQFSLRYNAELRDKYGTTTVSAAGVYSPGELTGNNSDETFQQARAGAEAEYYYGTLKLERVNTLPWDFSLYVSARGQLASGNLLASEQVGLGGFSSVRGYDNFTVRGDEGAVVNVELRSPSFPILGLLNEQINDRLQLLAFYDYGIVRNKERLPQELDDISLASVGVGLRYQLGTYLSVRLDYGWKLEDIEFLEEDDGRLDFSVIASF